MLLEPERNKLQNLLSMGFDGGVNANTPYYAPWMSQNQQRWCRFRL